MKILMTLGGLDIGDTETHVVELSEQLVNLGHQVVIVSEKGTYTDHVLSKGIKFVCAPLSGRDFKSVYTSMRILKYTISEEKPDVVHAHTRFTAFLCRMIGFTTRIIFVTTFHSAYSKGFFKKFFTFWGKKTLVVSDHLKRHLKDSYRLKSKRITVSLNGVDTDRFSPDSAYESVLPLLGFEKSAKRIIYMNRLDEGVCTPLFKLLEIFEELDDIHPGLELMILGNGNSFEKIAARAREINIRLSRTAVALTGIVTDVPRYISAADIAIGAGRSALECLSMGKPTIIAGHKGYIGIFDRTNFDVAVETNFTCRNRMDIHDDKFKHDILSLLEMSSEERLTLGAYGRSIVVERFSARNMVNDNLKFYDSVLTTKHYDCSILGYYGFKNSGDDTLLYAMINSLRETNPDIKINVFSFNPKETTSLYNVDSVFRYNIFKTHKAIKNSELFILGGGSLIQDVTSTKSLLYYLWMICRAFRHKTPVMLYANGIGPVNKPRNRRLVKKVLNRVSFITLRDENSLKELKTIGVNKPETIVTADPVFAVNARNDAEADRLLKESGISEDEKFAVLSVRNWKALPEDFNDIFASMADYISSRHGLTPVFVPLHYPFDASASRKIISKMKSRALFIGGRTDIPTTLSIVKKSSLTISIRLHMLIYSACAGVPSIGISYDPKVTGFQSLIDQPAIKPADFKPEVYEKIIDESMENHEELSEKLLEDAEKLKKGANITARLASELMR